MLRYPDIVEEHLRQLSRTYEVWVSQDRRWTIASRFRLPPGFNVQETRVLIGIPPDYPITPPGFDPGVYVPNELRYAGRTLADSHAQSGRAWAGWSWLCYQAIGWNARSDNLVRFLEMLRADLTNPRTM